MAAEIFNRYENKYIISTQTLKKLKPELLRYTQPDKHNEGGAPYQIHSIYFDTSDDNLIRRSLAKPVYREKVRLRSYTDFEDDSMVFLEIKKKYNGKGNKRRTKILFHEAMRFIATGEKPELQPYMNVQVIDELHHIIRREPLMPKSYISYDRYAFSGESDPDLRITLDTNVRSERVLLAAGLWIMEVKVARAMPLWLASLLTEHKVYHTGFSKYGTDYNAAITERIKANESRKKPVPEEEAAHEYNRIPAKYQYS